MLRSNPTLQANAAQILVDPRLNVARFTAAARSFDNLGWYLGTSGVGLLYLPDGAAIPDRLPFGLRSPVAGAVFGWPDGVWAATDRTPLAEAALTFVASDLKEFRSLQGLPASGLPFNQVRELAGRARRSGPRPTAGSRGSPRTTGGSSCSTRPAGCPTAGSTLWSRARAGSRSGRARRRAGRRLAPDRAGRAALRRPRVRGLSRPATRCGSARRAGCCWPCRGRTTWCGRPRSRRPSLQASIVALALAGRHARGAHARPVALARSPDQVWTLGPNLSGLLGGLVGVRGRRPGLLGGRRSGRRLRPAQHAAAAPAPRGRPAGPEQRPRGGRRVSLGRHRRRTGALPPRRHPAVTDRACRRWRARSARARVRPHPAPSPRRSGGSATGAGRRLRGARGRPTRCWSSSTDASVEGVHFRRAWLSLEEIGWRAAAAALSDLAAEGAEPAGLLVALTVPADADGRRRRGGDARRRRAPRPRSARGSRRRPLRAGPRGASAVTVLGLGRRRRSRARARSPGRRALGHRRARRRARGARGVAARGASRTRRRARRVRAAAAADRTRALARAARRPRDARSERRAGRRRRPPRGRVGRRAGARPRARAGGGTAVAEADAAGVRAGAVRGRGRGGLRAAGGAARRRSDARTRSPSRASPGCRSRASGRCGRGGGVHATLGGKPVALAGFDHFAPRRR